MIVVATLFGMVALGLVSLWLTRKFPKPCVVCGLRHGGYQPRSTNRGDT